MSQYRVYVAPAALEELRQPPGHMKQRVRRAIDDLARDPQPSGSRPLTFDTPLEVDEVRRLRIDRWRIIYAISAEDRIIDILAVRKRPPYDCDDLSELIGSLD